MRRFLIHGTLLLATAGLLSAGCNQSSSLPENTDTDAAGPAPADMTVAPPASTDLAVGPDLAVNNGSPSTTYPAAFPAPPQIISGGGPVLSTPRFVPIFFSNDDPAARTRIIDFLTKVGGTNYWKVATQEYGVHAGTIGPVVDLAEMSTGTFDDTAIQAWLTGKLNADDPAFPKNDRNTVYVIHYPVGVTITQRGGFGGGTSKSCVQFGGYHGDVQLDNNHRGANVAYAVIPRCAGFNQMTAADTLTSTESHELVEAATDPYPHSNPANAQVDEDHLYWGFLIGGGENGDLCAQDPSSFTIFPELPTYMVQRSWSNEAIMAGHDPCVPAPDPKVQPYFAAVPELNDVISLNFGQQINMLGVQIPVGQERTIDLDLFSDGDTGGPWTVKVRDGASLTGGTASLGFMLDRNHGQNGEKIHLTIKSTRRSQFGAASFAVISQLGGAQHIWFGLVGQ